MKKKTLLSLIDLQDYLGIKESHLRSLVFKRKIPFIKVGRLLRFDVDEIDQWIEKNSNLVESLGGE